MKVKRDKFRSWWNLFSQLVYFVFLYRPVRCPDAHHKGQSQGSGGDADDDGGQDQNMGQGIRVVVYPFGEDWSRASFYFGHGDIEDKNRGLKNIETDYLFDKIVTCDHRIQTDYHE